MNLGETIYNCLDHRGFWRCRWSFSDWWKAKFVLSPCDLFAPPHFARGLRHRSCLRCRWWCHCGFLSPPSCLFLSNPLCEFLGFGYVGNKLLGFVILLIERQDLIKSLLTFVVLFTLIEVVRLLKQRRNLLLERLPSCSFLRRRLFPLLFGGAFFCFRLILMLPAQLLKAFAQFPALIAVYDERT